MPEMTSELETWRWTCETCQSTGMVRFLSQAEPHPGLYSVISAHRKVAPRDDHEPALTLVRVLLADYMKSETVELTCDTCDTDRRVTVAYEYEPGEYGSRNVSWPVYTVAPPCLGPEREKLEPVEPELSAPADNGRTFRITGTECVPEDCPFHADTAYGDDHPEQRLVHAVLRERHAIKRFISEAMTDIETAFHAEEALA